MGMMKNYLYSLVCCVEEQFGQDAIEWAIFSGWFTPSYHYETDVAAIFAVVETIPGEKPVTQYDRILEAYRRVFQRNEAECDLALATANHLEPLFCEILRPFPLDNYKLPAHSPHPQTETVGDFKEAA